MNAERAVLHREVYSSMLKGLLTYGTAKTVATQVIGITPVYLSNLTDPDHTPPSEALARRIVAVLPLAPEMRDGLLEHMLLARQYQAKPHFTEEVGESEADLAEIYRAFHMAYAASVLERGTNGEARWLLITRDLGKQWLAHARHTDDPLAFAEVCLILQNVQSVLNRWDDALFYAKWADAVLQTVHPREMGDRRPQFEHLRINVLDAEIVAYRNLGLPRRAVEASEAGLHLLRGGLLPQRDFWQPHLLKDRLEALARTPRFTLSEVEGLADQVWRLCEAGRAPNLIYLPLMVDRALLNAFVRYGSPRSLRKAGQLVKKICRQIEDAADLDPMRRTMLAFSVARYFWMRERHDEWSHYTRMGVAVAEQAGLRHQLSEARRSFGDALDHL